MDNTNTFDLNSNNSGTEPQTNPLNTGNGAVQEASNPEITPQTTDTQPHEIKLDNLATNAPATTTDAPQQAEAAAPIATSTEPPAEASPLNTTPEPVTVNPPPPESKSKLYVIIAVAVLLAITLGYFGYGYFFAEDAVTTEETITEETENKIKLKNTLSQSNDEEVSEEMKELDSVVSDLKEIYSESETSSSPPSLVIDLSATEETEAETNDETSEEESAESSKKISR